MTSTPYDDVFRTIENDCARMLLPLLNEMFGEKYRGDEQIIFSANEHFLNRQDGEEEKRITDSSFTVQGKLTSKKYHLECQSTPDSSMLVRIFEYDAQIALDAGTLRKDMLYVSFPHSAVLFLRSADTTPDQMRIVIHTPGGEVGYTIPVMKMQQYGVQVLFEKKLWFLIPFLIFNYEKKFSEYEKNTELRKELLADYKAVVERMETLSIQGEINAQECSMLLDMSKNVLEHIAAKYQHVKREVCEIMGGKVLEYESKTLWRNAKAEGRQEGKAEGRTEGMLVSIRSLMQTLKMTAKEAMDALQIPEEEQERYVQMLK